MSALDDMCEGGDAPEVPDRRENPLADWDLERNLGPETRAWVERLARRAATRARLKMCEPDDVVEEVWLAILCVKALLLRIPEGTRPKFVRRIVRRTVTKLKRREHARKRISHDAPSQLSDLRSAEGLADLIVEEGSPDAVVRDEDVERLRRTLEQILAPLASIVRELDLEQRSAAEAAAEREISRSYLYRLRRRGLAFIRRLWGGG